VTTTKNDPVLVVLQLAGGNDYMNTVIPYADPLYRDYRPNIGVPEDQIIKLDAQVGLHPSMAPLKRIYDQGKLAIIHGIGYPNSSRSHFRSMDIWHTCEPEKQGTEGWLGAAIRDLDPNKENVATGVYVGQGLPRAMVLRGVPVASVADLATYGLFSAEAEQDRTQMLETFAHVYSPAIGRGAVMDYLGSTGLDAMMGADILKVAPQRYSSAVEYADSSIARKLRDIAQIHVAGLGTRVFYTDLYGFDTHSSELRDHPMLWSDVSEAVEDFFEDLREHNAADNVILMMFTEFGRRVVDNGSGTDHGGGGAAFVIGDAVKGGHHSEYPSLKPEDQQLGDLAVNHDFRGFYSTILEKWMSVDARPIVGGSFEQLAFL
jgi:uncharacterized protein (DUF1501 family)